MNNLSPHYKNTNYAGVLLSLYFFDHARDRLGGSDIFVVLNKHQVKPYAFRFVSEAGY